MNGPTSIFFSTERDIFDALMSSPRKMTRKVMLAELAALGVFLPSETEREEAAEYYSLLPHDYHYVDRLSEKLSSVSAKDKRQSVAVGCELGNDDITEVVEALRSEIDPAGEAISVASSSKKSKFKQLSYEYTEVDHGKTPLKQKQPRDSEIELEQAGDGVTRIRFPANDKTKKLVDKAVDLIRERKGVEEQADELSLEDIPEPQKRTKFFVDLVRSLEGFDLEDVSKVEVYRKRSDSSGEDEDEEEQEEDIATFVRKAALDGEGLLYSEEYQRLYEQGFFISRIVWSSIERAGDCWRYSFEASFADPESGCGFKYHVRGGYPPLGEGRFAVTRKSLNPSEQIRLYRIIEQAANAALASVMGS